MGRTTVGEVAGGDAGAGIAVELRGRRQLLGLSQVALSQISGISRTVINKVEQGARVPSVRTYARLRAALGLEAPAAALIPKRLPTRLEDDYLTALCAGLLATQQVALADLASALEISIPAVRENLEAAAERLRPVGFSLTDDGGSVRLWPLPGTPSTLVRALTLTDEESALTAEQVAILGIVAFYGQAERALIEHYRGEDSASLLDRLTRRGLLAKVRSDRGAGGPNVYRVTAKALRAAGFATVEAMRAAIATTLTAAEQTLLQNHHGELVARAGETARPAAGDTC